MKRLSALAILLALALPASAHASTFAPDLGSPFPTRSGSYGVTTNDFNGDGLIDVAVVNGTPGDATSNNVSILLRRPGGGFTEEPGSPVPVPSGPNYVVSGDFGGSSQPDLAVATFGSSVVYVLVRNPENTGFTGAGSYSIPAGGSSLQTADFNGDGALDLIFGSWNSASVHVLTRSATGFSAQEPAYAVGTAPRQIAVGDYNGDGRPDVAVANWNSNSVSVLLRSANGTAFATESTIPVGVQPSGIGAGDFNGDGRVDVAVANQSDSSAQLLLRTAGNDGFTTTTPVAVPNEPINLAVADFDRNGTLDAAVTSRTGGAVTVLSGGTAPEPSIPLASAYGVVVTDFNGDQRQDLAVTSELGSFTALLNTTAGSQPPPPPVLTPTPTPTPPLPDPVAGRTVNATPVKGSVKVKLPGRKTYSDLAQAQQLPVGTTFDTRKGTVQITAAGNGGTAKFFDGLFKLSQTTGKRPLTTLTLAETLSCPKAKRASAAAAKQRSRKLWGDGKGAFRTRGKYSAATVRGTKWLVTDRCDRTTTKVTQGSVTVRDFAKRRNAIVRAGRSYTARNAR